LLRIGVAAVRQIDTHGRDLRDVESRVGAGELIQTGDHQRRRDQQHHAKRGLQHDQPVQPPALRPRAGRGPHGPQLLSQLASRGTKRRHQADQQGTHRGHARGIGEHDRIDRHSAEAADVTRRHAHEEIERPPRNRDPTGRRCDGQSHGFGQEQSDDPRTRCPQRDPQCQLGLPRHAARGHQVRKVDARNQQYAPHRRKQEKQRPLRAADNRVELRHDLGTAVGIVGGKRLRQAGHHAFELGLRAGRADSGAQPSDDLDEVRAALRRHRRIRGILDPCVLRHRHPQFGRRRGDREDETQRHDADDREAAAVDRQRRADRIDHATQVSAAKFLTDDHDLRSGPVFIVVEAPSDHRFDAKRGEQVCGHHGAAHVQRRPETGDRETGRVMPGHCLERLSLGTPVEEVRPRHRSGPWGRAPQVQFAHRDQPIRIRKRQRPEHDRADDAEHGGIGADAEGQREHRGNGERGRSPQRSPRIAEVLPEFLDRRPSPHAAHRFLDQQHIAELVAGRSGGLFGRFATIDAILNRQIQVTLDLLGELCVLTPAPHRESHGSCDRVRLSTFAIASDSWSHFDRAPVRCLRPRGVRR
jgi:hypothetical protein